MERHRGHGFMLTDLAAALIVAVIVAAFLVLCGANQRRLARLGDDLAHLKDIGAATLHYGADNLDTFPTYSWRRGPAPVDPSDPNATGLLTASGDLQAAANQMVYILRTRGRQTDFPVLNGFIPHILYNHLPLAAYLDRDLPWRTAVSSADRNRLQWSQDPACFNIGCFPCQPSPSDPNNRRWPFSGSFMPGIAFFDLSPAASRISQQGQYNFYITSSSTVLGGCRLSSVAFPSQKAMIHDQNARHFGDLQPYCTHPQARLPLLMSDGSVPVRSAADANPGWNPNSPTTPSPLTFLYAPSGNCWEPAPISPSGDLVQGRFRYTRNGIFGRDFGGPEVD
jgi:hypothetical protein